MNDVLAKQKENCAELLDKLKSIGLEAICAGGFPREYMLYEHKLGTRKARDFDIYIKGPITDSIRNDLYRVGLLGTILFKNRQGLDPRTGEEYDEVMNGIEHIISGTFRGKSGTFDRTELIFVDTDKTLKDYVYNHFDVSICMATFDGEEFDGSKSFYKTLSNRKITFNKDLSPELTEYAFKKHINKLIKNFGHSFKFDFNCIEVPEFAIMDGFNLVKRTKIAERMKKDNIVLEAKNALLVRTR